MLHIKPDKIRKRKSISTLDETHKKYMETFKKSHDSIDSKKSKLESLKKKLSNIENDRYSDNNTKLKIKSEMETIELEIKDITTYSSELSYYSKLDDILCEYYNIVDNNLDSQIHTVNFPVVKKNRHQHKKNKDQKYQSATNDIMTFFIPKVDTSAKTESDKLSSESPKQNLNSRAALHEKYVKIINGYCGNYDNENGTKYCNKCNIERILVQTEGIYVCPECGELETALIESDIPNYKDSNTEKTSYPYKRLNHFIEWLNQFQGKESTDIPKETYDLILSEIQKHGIKNIQKISMPDMRVILRKLGLNKYYEHSASIISKITGKPPPSISRETEEELKMMFREIQEPFSKFCPRERTNFLSYSYVLHKFFQILEMHEFVERLPLLKSREKLRSQDKIWKFICDELGWKFYPSI